MRTAPSSARILLSVLWLLSVGVVSATDECPPAGTDVPSVDLGIDAFLSGLHRWNDDTLRRAQRIFQCVRNTGTVSEAILDYWSGTTLFFRSSHALFGPEDLRNRDSAVSHIDRALGYLRSCAERGRWPGECAAMEGTLYGQQIYLNPLRALTLGPRIQELRRDALALGGQSPRVWHLIGVNYYHSPEMFGGGPGPALPYFLKADSLFRAVEEPPSPPAPGWGEAINAGFVARVYDELGDTTKAIAWYLRASALNPYDPVSPQRLEELR